MKFFTHLIFIILIAGTIVSCSRPYSNELETGIWRATLKTESGAEIPFNFEVTDSAGRKVITILNGKERIEVNEIRQEGDSLFITMPFFESEIRTKLNKNGLNGYWIRHLSDSNPQMKISARPDESWRFFNVKASENRTISGRWSVAFTSENNVDTTAAIGEFIQDGKNLTGTFLTSTGDYRFLEGNISDNSIYLSSFDGENAYLFTGKLSNDSTIAEGKFYSGLKGTSKWTARKDDQAFLPDAYSLTALKPGYDKIDFSFKNLEGKEISLSDPAFQNKVVLVQFFGSWCPNCLDETVFLTSFYDEYKDRGLEIIALAYERTSDPLRARKNVKSLKDRLNVNYEMLLTGYTNAKGEVAKSLPMLKDFVAFPTLFIIDRKGKVRNIHTGFNGPGTGTHYQKFVSEFSSSIEQLLNE